MPKWRGDGRELFFVQTDGMLVIVTPDAPGVPTPLFRLSGSLRLEGERVFAGGNPGRERSVHYDVTPDGQRFVIRTSAPGIDAHALRMQLHWAAPR
jgi:hypothetical protein